MDSGIDLNPPPLGLLLLEEHSFFWEGNGLRSCLGPVLGQLKSMLFLQRGLTYKDLAFCILSGLGQPLINCSYGAI